MSTNQELLPHPEVSQPPSGDEEQLGKSVEVSTPKEKYTKRPAVVALPQDKPTTVPASPAAPAVPSSPRTPVQAGPASIIADDVDLIEKEWVDRAKAIVEATQDDPRKQKSEISKVKAEYIQKRFNKTIKVDSAA